MLDLSQHWPRIPDWKRPLSLSAGLVLDSVPDLRQYMVSGNLDPFGESIGAFGSAAGDRVALRAARDRILAVNPDDHLVAAGWHPLGYAMTDVSAMYHAFELSGDDLDDVISEAVAIDPQNGGPSAATLFAGMQAFVYWRAAGRLRLHVERPFTTHIVSWLQSRSESLSGSS